MKTVIAYNKAMILIIAIFVTCEIVKAEKQPNQDLITFRSVDTNEIPKILNTISDMTQDNYKRIKTWEGKVESEIDYIYEGENADRIFKESTLGIGEFPRNIINSVKTDIIFALDTNIDSLYVYNQPATSIKYTDMGTGRDLGVRGFPSESRAILTKDYYIQSEAYRMYKGEVESHKAIKKKLADCPACQNPPIFDPRESFKSGRPVWETAKIILKQIDKNGEWKVNGYKLIVEEADKNDAIQYRVTLPGKITEDYIVFSTMVFSGDKGFNITSYKATDVNDKIFQQATWDYELIGGVYLPKEVTQNNYMGKENSLNYSKRSVFKNMKLNQAIPGEIFTYKNLGLKNGDKFIDKIAGKEYKYQDANLVFVADINNMSK
jgi:hypothetical protein